MLNTITWPVQTSSQAVIVCLSMDSLCHSGILHNIHQPESMAQLTNALASKGARTNTCSLLIMHIANFTQAACARLCPLVRNISDNVQHARHLCRPRLLARTWHSITLLGHTHWQCCVRSGLPL